MSDLNIEFPTARQRLGEMRSEIDDALADAFPPGMLQSRWEEDTLHLAGAGAVATVSIEDGLLVGKARLGPPASMMRGMIEAKMTELLRVFAAGGTDV